MKCRGCGFPYPPCELVDKGGNHPDITGICLQCLHRDRDAWRNKALELEQNLAAVNDLLPKHD